MKVSQIGASCATILVKTLKAKTSEDGLLYDLISLVSMP